MTTQIALRLPDDLLDQLDALVPSAHASRSEAIRHAIEEYVYRQACERDARLYERAPLSEAELALADDPEAWSATPSW
jgi:metal-responsive CopG/Arc/MetJ family transcriptional regulator